MAALKPKEAAALETLRGRIQELNLDDYQSQETFLLRWLRARDFNATKAEEMLRKYLQWRKDNDIDRILSWEPPEIFAKEYPFKICGYDNDGCPVFIAAIGKWDLPKLVEMKLKGEYQRYIDQIIETGHALCEYRSKKTGKNITQIIGISDLEGLTYRKFASKDVIELSLDAVKRVEAMHPEVLKGGFGINVPKVFTLFYAIVKPFFSDYTQSKIHLHGFNSETWRNFLRSRIPVDQLPSEYGGSNTTCPNYVQSAGFDSIGVTYGPYPEDQMVTVEVEAGKMLEIETPNCHNGSVLQWAFKTVDYDIGFALTRVQGGIKEDLVRVDRADAHVSVQRGRFVCGKEGKYFLVFDNSYSRMRPKSITYCCWIEDLTRT